MENKKYTCNLCNKGYKTPQSLWNHKKKIHENNINNDQKMTKNKHINDPKMTQNIEIDDLATNLNNDIKLTENTECMYCHKKFSAYTHMRRHLKICKEKETYDLKKLMDKLIQDNKNKDEKIKEMNQSFEKFKKEMINSMNKKYKMHYKTFQKMINSNNFSNNNITINNNIKYIAMGREDLHNVFSKQEKLNILKQHGSPIENIVRYTHMNEKYPQFQNIIITNIRSNQAYAYNDQLNKFILCDKNELLEEMMVYRYDDLIEFYNQYHHLLLPKLRDTLNKSFLLKDDTSFCKNKCKEFNVIIYNECNKDNIKYKLNDDKQDDLSLDDTIIDDTIIDDTIDLSLDDLSLNDESDDDNILED
jgi:hypothetical protein